ncbi:MAG TPA: 23S rRNA (guanosine(2251)-2'-O)-methyltransferase RlmB [Alphaproteobacteria bacterium]|nr:23S rRNA (guanosine(2251)-2'-O)-methyltransferase RlmB [Alphaproteobacteria bacterium]
MYWMYGKHACIAALKNPLRKIKKIHVTSLKLLEDIAKPFHKITSVVDKKVVDTLVGSDVVHQGIAVQLDPLEPQSSASFFDKPSCTLAMLDQVTDPHNIGAVLRSCAVFGIDGIILQTKHAPGETAVLAKTACGALELVPVLHTVNLSQELELLKKNGFWVYGFSEKGKSPLNKVKFANKSVLILGAEGEGMRPLVQKGCDELLYLASSSLFSTLNVSNAAAVAFYEAFCQKNVKQEP